VDKKLVYTVGIGLYGKLKRVFEEDLGYVVDMADTQPVDIAGFRRLMPNAKRVESIDWRNDQLDIVNDIMSVQHGQYQLSTGAGKSYMISKLCEVFDKARIIVTTYRLNLLQDMYAKLMQQGQVDAGIYTSKNKDPRGRVLLCSLGTLHRFTDYDFDIMMVDEKHECATLQRIDSLLSINCRKAYAFSADDDNRGDGADAWLEVMFGPLRRQITHVDSVLAGDIVPVRVNWIKVEDRGFSTNASPGSDAFDRRVYRDNPIRNAIAADTAKQVKSDGQTLVYTSKVEHAYRLRALLDCPVAHAPKNAAEWDVLKQLGLVSAQEKSPTEADMTDLRRRFSEGRVPLAISNSVWRQGVDFPQLRSLVRTDASTSAIDATQISGRLTRKVPGKTVGNLYDFHDVFYHAAERRSDTRRNLYRNLGYQQSPVPR
jgi:superfamily II DNA or RNA helicase